MTMMTRRATVDLETISGTTGLLLHETLAMMTVTTMMLTMMTMATMMLTAPDANANPLPILRGDKNMNNENSISGSEDGDKNDVSQQLRNRNNLTPTELSESEYKRINNLNLTRWAS